MSEIRPLLELAQYRKRKGLSRKALADQLDVSAVTVWRWERGERRPAREHVAKLAEITGVPPTEILGVQ